MDSQSEEVKKSIPVEISRSRPSLQSIVSLIQPRYDFLSVQPAPCVYVLSEGTSLVYSIYPKDGPPQYALHVLEHGSYHVQSQQDVDFMADVRDHMRQQGVSTPAWIRLTDEKKSSGFSISCAEGPRWCFLEKWVELVSLPELPDAFREWGVELARFHVTGNSFRTRHERSFETNLATLVTDPILKALTLPALQNHPEWQLRLAQKAMDVATQIRDFAQGCSSDEYGLIHGDHHYGNVKRIKDQNRVCLLDTEFVSRGWRVLDLAESRRYTILDLKDRELGDSLWKAFLEGYQTIRRLSNAEISIIPVFMAASHLWSTQFDGMLRPDPDVIKSCFKDIETCLSADNADKNHKKRKIEN